MVSSRHAFALAAAAVVCLWTAGRAGAETAKVELTLVDGQATGYATFQSHNQKVLANAGGIFMTHIRSRNEAFNAQQWRLSRSTDAGKTFATVFEATHATNPPVIETDEAGNVYLVRPDFSDNHSYLYLFLRADDYQNPRESKVPGSGSGKFAMAYDASRKQLYYASQNHTFHTLALDGTLKSSATLLAAGTHALLQYPLLQLDESNALHYAWTTQKHGVYMYWDIHSMRSPDGGQTWRTMAGAALTAPIVCDDTGPTDRVSLDDEFDVHTWLASFVVRSGKAHYFYVAQHTPWRTHYVRYDLASGKRDVHLSPTFKGERIELIGMDGFFAASPTTLYCVSHTPDGRIGCLASDDNGATWRDHAVSDDRFEKMYALGGCRAVTPDGFIIGSFTDSLASPAESVSTSKVYFVKIPTAGK